MVTHWQLFLTNLQKVGGTALTNGLWENKTNFSLPVDKGKHSESRGKKCIKPKFLPNALLMLLDERKIIPFAGRSSFCVSLLLQKKTTFYILW